MSQNGQAHLPFWDNLSTLRHYEAFNGNKTEHATIVISLQKSVITSVFLEILLKSTNGHLKQHYRKVAFIDSPLANQCGIIIVSLRKTSYLNFIQWQIHVQS